VRNVGKSFEGRDIKIALITNGDGRKKNSIFIDAGFHGREWIAPATALYLIQQLVDPQGIYAVLLNDLDFAILPLVNPDGYEYSIDYDRQWRKTRSRTKNRNCVGVDANRNFPFRFGSFGSVSDPCHYSQAYHGQYSFSEKESQTVSNVMWTMRHTCKFYLTLHSFGNLIMYPWGYTKELPAGWRAMDEVARAGATAIKNYSGTQYRVGSLANLLYRASGSSGDRPRDGNLKRQRSVWV